MFWLTQDNGSQINYKLAAFSKREDILMAWKLSLKLPDFLFFHQCNIFFLISFRSPIIDKWKKGAPTCVRSAKKADLAMSGMSVASAMHLLMLDRTTFLTALSKRDEARLGTRS